MAKNVLDAQRRLILQDWMKKVKRSGFVDMQNIKDIHQHATTDLGFCVSPSHIRNNARILDMHLPRGYRYNNKSIKVGIDQRRQVRKSFTCPCGRRYSVGVYLNRKSEPITI